MRTMPQLATLLAAATLSLSANAVSFSFNTNAQGWTVIDGGGLTYQGTGGNGGGFLQIEDVTNDDFKLLAPAAVLGNWSQYLGGSLSFDGKNLDSATADWDGFGVVTITSADGNITPLVLDTVPYGQPAIGAGWKRYSVALTTAVWGASLPAVLADVSRLTIQVEFHAGQPEMVGIDNISISPVPEPTEVALLLAGLGVVAGAARRRR
jgi:hypothetical protein